MASAAMISLRGRIHKHASQEDLLALPLPLPFTSRGRGASRGDRDHRNNNPDRPSPRAVRITLTLLVLSMLGTLAVLNNLMRAELARELSEQQHPIMEEGKMADRGVYETPASGVEASGSLGEVRCRVRHCALTQPPCVGERRLALLNLNPRLTERPNREDGWAAQVGR